MKAWFSSQPTRLDILRQITKGSTPLVRVLYATPERDEIKPACVHIFTDADELAEEIKR